MQSPATTNWREAVPLERDVIDQARNGALMPKAGPSRLFAACDGYLAAKRATENRERTVAFDEERLAMVKDFLGDVLLSTITREMIEGFQAKGNSTGSATAHQHGRGHVARGPETLRPLAPAAGPRRDVERGQEHTHRSGPHDEEQSRLLETAASNPE
jgi:hypothetical protein